MSALLAPITWASALWTCSGKDNTGGMGNVPANPSRVGARTYFWVGSTPGQHQHLRRLSPAWCEEAIKGPNLAHSPSYAESYIHP